MAYALAVFVHVTSAMGLFASLAIEAASLLHARRAGSAHREVALAGYRWVGRVGPPSLAGVVLAGLYLAGTAWGWREPWIDVALAGLAMIGVVGATMTFGRIGRLARAGDRGGFDDPVLWRSLTLRTALVLGVEFLMTVKPGWAGSLGAIAVAIGAGLIGGRPLIRRLAVP